MKLKIFKILSSCLVLVSCFSFSFKVLAEDGSPGDPYIVNDCTELQAVGSGAGGWNLDKTYNLGNDIDCTAVDFQPIGSSVTPFTGTFDGQNFSISNLVINKPLVDYVGLFSQVTGGTVKNFTLASGSVTGQGYVGAVVGYITTTSTIDTVSSALPVVGTVNSGVGGLFGGADGTDLSNKIHLTNVSSSGDIVLGSIGSPVTFVNLVGGVLGSGDYVSINGMSYSGDITIYSSNLVSQIGGLSGYLFHSDFSGSIFNTGNILTSSLSASGIAGLFGGVDSITIDGAYSTGNITVTTTGSCCEAAGLIGDIDTAAGIISNSYNTGDIVINSGSFANDVGTFVGAFFSDNGQISDSYSTGDLTITSVGDANNSGGFVGYFNDGSSISNSYMSGGVTMTLSSGDCGNTGGFVGYMNDNSLITDSYVSGLVNFTCYAANSGTGGLLGYMNSGDIINSHVDNDVTVNLTGAGQSAEEIAGLLGYGWAVNVVDNYVTGDLSITSQAGGTDMGGLIGYFHNTGTISGNYMTGAFTLVDVGANQNFSNIGGIIGNGVGTITFDNNYSTGAISVNAYDVSEVGGAVGFFTKGTSSGSYSTSNISITSAHDAYEIGGLFGFADFNPSFSIDTCYATGDITINVVGTVGDAGGLIGGNEANVDQCYSTGNVSVTSSGGTIYDVGGLIGTNYNNTLSNSFALGNVNGDQHVGGLIGTIESTSTVNNTYSAGDVVGDDYVGGLIGQLGVGGLSVNTVSNSFAASNLTVNGGTHFGGLLGFYQGTATITNNFFDKFNSGQTLCASQDALGTAGCTGVNTANATPNYFINNHTSPPLDVWDFVATWDTTICSYPVLHNLPGVAGLCNQDPDVPSSLGPVAYVNGSSDIDTTPTLNFNLSDPDVADTVKYRIQIDNNSNFSSPVVDYTSVLGAQGAFSFTVGQAVGGGVYTIGSFGQELYDGSYYWKVSAIDENAAQSAYTSANSGSIAFVITGTPSLCPEPVRISMSNAGVQGDVNSPKERIAMSSNARYTVFASESTNLVSGDTNGVSDVFIYDRVLDTLERVSVSTLSAEGNGASAYPSISADGRYVAFESSATNLTSGDINSHADIFIRDIVSDTTTLVSTTTIGAQGDADSRHAFISPDGNVIGFSSVATNLVAGDTNSLEDVFVKNLTSGTVTRVSVSTSGVEANGTETITPALSYDGRYVAFQSNATSLAAGDNNSAPDDRDVFWHDTQTGITLRVSQSTGGVGADSWSGDPAISWDGRYVGYESFATNLVAGDTNGDWDVFLYDTTNLTNERVSVDENGDQVDWAYAYYEYFMSYDARYIVFESNIPSLGVGTDAYSVYKRDRLDNTTTLISQTNTCSMENSGSGGAAISAGGQYVGSAVWSSNLTVGDTNGVNDVLIFGDDSNVGLIVDSLGPVNNVNGSTSVDTSPTFTFSTNLPSQYHIQIDNDSDFSSPTVDYTSELGLIDDLSFTVGQAAGSGTYSVGSFGQTLSNDSYYWRVEAIDDADSSSGFVEANSGLVAFIVDVPTPPAPAGGVNGGGFSTVIPFVVSLVNNNQPTPPPAEDNTQTLPPCPAVLGDFIAAVKNGEKNQKEKTNENNGNSKSVGNAKVKDVSSVLEINNTFVQAIEDARESRSKTILDAGLRGKERSEIVKMANNTFKLARELARRMRKLAKAALKNKPVVVVPVPLVAENSNTTNDATVNANTNPIANNTSTETNGETVANTNTDTTNNNNNTNSSSTTTPTTNNTQNSNTSPSTVYPYPCIPSVVNNTEDVVTPDAPVVDVEDSTPPITPVTIEEVSPEPDSIVKDIQESLSDFVVEYYSILPPTLQDFFSSPRLGLKEFGIEHPVVKTVAVYTGGTAVTLPLITSVILLARALGSGVSVLNLITYLVVLIPQLLRIRKESKPWGTVYNSSNGRPLPFVRVEILNSEMRQLDSTVTDINGRYGFLVARDFTENTEQMVSVNVNQKDYIFPSNTQPSKNEQILYPNTYMGGWVPANHGVMNLDIPMDPEKQSRDLPPYFGLVSVSLNNLWVKLTDVLFIAGLAFGLSAYYVNPTVVNFIPIILILLTGLLRLFGLTIKSFGITKDRTNNKPMPFGLVTLYSEEGERVNFTVSDSLGRYFILSPKGRYQLKAYTPSHVVPPREYEVSLNAKKGWVSEEITL